MPFRPKNSRKCSFCVKLSTAEIIIQISSGLTFFMLPSKKIDIFGYKSATPRFDCKMEGTQVRHDPDGIYANNQKEHVFYVFFNHIFTFFSNFYVFRKKTLGAF